MNVRGDQGRANSLASSSEAFQKYTRDKNEQHDHDVKTTERKEVEGAAAGSRDNVNRWKTENKRNLTV